MFKTLHLMHSCDHEIVKTPIRGRSLHTIAWGGVKKLHYTSYFLYKGGAGGLIYLLGKDSFTNFQTYSLNHIIKKLNLPPKSSQSFPYDWHTYLRKKHRFPLRAGRGEVSAKNV